MLESDNDINKIDNEDDVFVVQTTLTEEDLMESMIQKAVLQKETAKGMHVMSHYRRL
jgi:hypothetical protein